MVSRDGVRLADRPIERATPGSGNGGVVAGRIAPVAESVRIAPVVDPVRLAPQILIIAAAVAAYFLVRGATDSAAAVAVRNAGRVLEVERLLGLAHEVRLQEAVAGWPGVTTVLNWVYIWGHWPVIVVTLVWLARRHPDTFRRTRNAMMLSGGIGLVVFATFPVAPPRLAGLGMVDTVTAGSQAYRVLQPTMFTNQYAAMPSLHVGWDLLIGLAVVVAARRWYARAIGVAMPVAMTVAVVLTANHYIVDAMVGAALTTTCWVVCGQLRRRSRRTVELTAPELAAPPAPLDVVVPRPRPAAEAVPVPLRRDAYDRRTAA